ncbi:MAG: GntR protein [Marmoricola sp.]|nr:GntR protein [Marmoricola sp.]
MPDNSTHEDLRPVSRGRLYEQVVARLREHAASAGLSAGSKLPTERDLAQRLGVSRASVAQAVVALEVQGLVETRQGGGVYLVRDSLDAESIPDLLARRDRLPDVLDARDALETKIAELAAARRTLENLAEIETALESMREEVASGQMPTEGDRRFHAAVVAAADSKLLASFYETMRDGIAESRKESLRQPGRAEDSLRDHERIARAIRAQDAAGAREAMHTHLERVRTVRLLNWDPN